MSIKNTITIVAVLALVAGAGALYWNHRQAIYREGWDDAAIQLREELDLQEAVNREAMRLANVEYLKNIDRLTVEKETLDAQLDILFAASVEDPRANQCGIGLGSVQRLNSIR